MHRGQPRSPRKSSHTGMAGAAPKPTIYVLDAYHEDAITQLQNDPTINVVLPPDATKDAALANAVGLLIRSESRITTEDMRRANPSLKYIVKQGVGVDNVDLKAAKASGIGVYNTPGLNSEAVAELTLTLALCIARRVNELDRAIRQGDKVVRSQMLAKSLFGKTLGVIGMGAIGTEVAKKWRAAMAGPLVTYDPYGKDSGWVDMFGQDGYTRVHDLVSLLSVADVVTVHTPLTNSTMNMISEKEFATMKQDAILLNCARGGIVDETALLHALQSGKLFGAGLDAMQHEPPTKVQYGETLLSHPRVVMTPHVGASTEDNQARSGTRAVEILLDLLAGRGNHQSLM